MEVRLLHASPTDVALMAGLICTNNENNIEFVDSEGFISRIINQGHESVIEHIFYNFLVDGISRTCLQELARHRHISLSVQSTRWALKKIKDDINFYALGFTDNEKLEKLNETTEQLKTLIKDAIDSDVPNDILKYYVPESLTTKLVLSLNARELRHIFNLRTSKRALEEFRILCKNIFDVIPDEHKFMYQEFFK